MNNEHIPFEIEWAKRGGICAIDDEDIGKTTLYIFTQRGFIALNRRGRDFFWEMPTHGDLYKQAIDSDMRMATCAECEAAGVEYIEPPIRWMPIETMPERTTVQMSDGVNIDMRRAYKECAIQEGYTHWQPLPKPPKDE